MNNIDYGGLFYAHLNRQKTQFYLETLDASGAVWVRVCSVDWNIDKNHWRPTPLFFDSIALALKQEAKEENQCRIIEHTVLYITHKPHSKGERNGKS